MNLENLSPEEQSMPDKNDSKNFYESLAKDSQLQDNIEEENKNTSLEGLRKDLEGYKEILPDKGGVLSARIDQIYDKIANSGNISWDDLSDAISFANSINQELQNTDLRRQYSDSISNLQNLLSKYVSGEERAA